MALPRTEKQNYERYVVSGNYSKALNTSETIVLLSSLALAEDKDGNDMSTVVLEQPTFALDGSLLKVRVREGVEVESPYKITLRAETDEGNRFEIDFELRIKET